MLSKKRYNSQMVIAESFLVHVGPREANLLSSDALGGVEVPVRSTLTRHHDIPMNAFGCASHQLL